MTVIIVREFERIVNCTIYTYRWSKHPLGYDYSGMMIDGGFCHVVQGSFVKYVVIGTNEHGYFDRHDARDLAVRHWREVLTSD